MSLEPEDAVEWQAVDDVTALGNDSKEMGMLELDASCEISYAPAGPSLKYVLRRRQIEITN